ncbi:bifunctional RNase H/acid phosphatase [Lipingzhangella sp. LS1_29]|uniref:Bifunctional RNase H/acid phosphatase n=1 Tax=Lipingzhangella rawalii TaxID=2055835 RepID=A0ABU2H0H5_9ACTN|nr:bifunctional RNase H/acid phosphatase [Lipingzhangella rawalii]MDS1268810.1 bifunctional RNase H/acid phosphatase [Lipingzhangella rawalii]
MPAHPGTDDGVGLVRRLRIEADGGSRGNPGPAGYGAVVRDAQTEVLLAEVAEPIGVATNNAAEYRGLIAGLRRAAELAPSATVNVQLDSKLVVEQMSGRWRIKDPDLAVLAREAQELAAVFADVSYTWVPRERNAHADRLANAAMDGSSVDDGAHSAGSTPPSADRSTSPAGPGWAAPATDATTLLLLRHGQTELSVERRFAGRGDIPLTDVGVHQADRAASRLRDVPIDVVVSSPLRRARDTAAPVAAALGLDVEVHDGLTETDFGKWEGLTFAEAQQDWPEALSRWVSDPEQAPPGGESFAAVARRVSLARDELLRDYAGRSVLIVSHVTPIKTLLRLALLAPPEALYRMHLDVACLCEVDHYADGPAVVRSVNDTAHLHSSG